MPFTQLGLSTAILSALQEKGYQSPSPVQKEAIPVILSNKDVMACAQTGTGKTAAFVLPMLERLHQSGIKDSIHPQALILTPTRELAAQIYASINTYGKNLAITSTMIYGGVKMHKQIRRLESGVDILVATPGRLLDLHSQKAVDLSKIKILVLDEADRMLDMGFIHDIKRIISKLPHNRQNLLFSATFSNDIRKLSKGLLKNPIEINISPKNITANKIKHKVHPVDTKMKARLLAHLIQTHQWYQALIFTRTKHVLTSW